MTETHSPARAREARVYRAIKSHAIPFIIYTALIGLGLGVMFGVMASLSFFSALDGPMVIMYAMLGLFIGAVVAIHRVYCELLVFSCADSGSNE